MSLNKDAILAADDRRREMVEVPEWGGSVYVAVISGAERDAWEAGQLITKGTGKKKEREVSLKNIRASLLVRCIVDEEGKRLFLDGDAEALGRKSSSAIDRLYEVAARLNRISEEDVESLAEDFSEEGSDSDITNSPTPSDNQMSTAFSND